LSVSKQSLNEGMLLYDNALNLVFNIILLFKVVQRYYRLPGKIINLFAT